MFEMNRLMLIGMRNRLAGLRDKVPAGVRAAHSPTAPVGTVDPERKRRAVVSVKERQLHVEELTVKFGGVQAVSHVSIEVSPGIIHGLIGPNGAGKTSLIDAITGFAPITAGKITLDGEDITTWPAYRRSRQGVSRTFQSLELFDDLTIRENLAIGGDEHRRLPYVTDVFRPGRVQLSNAAQASVQVCGLEPDLDRRPTELPYGRRRLVAIARAMASAPSVLLLDEPAAGLNDTEHESFRTSCE